MGTLRSISCLVCAAVLATGASGTEAELRGTELTPEEVRGLYGALFLIEKVQRAGSDKPRVSASVAELPADHPLAELTHEHRDLLGYALWQAELPPDTLQEALSDPSFPDSYLAALLADETFETTIFEIVRRYIHAAGGTVAGGVPATERTFPEADLLRVAVRFIYPDVLHDGGQIGVHYCSHRNGLEGLRDRDPFLEALAYAGVIRELYREPSPLVGRVGALVGLAKELQLTGNEDVILARVQGVVWGGLLQSVEMRSLLRREYERSGHLLPVVIQWDTVEIPVAGE